MCLPGPDLYYNISHGVLVKAEPVTTGRRLIMDFSVLSAQRYSVRNFSDRTVEPEKLTAILKAGQVAPTAANKQPQRILIIQDPVNLAKAAACINRHFNAPCLVIVCTDTHISWKRASDGFDSATMDAGIVTTHMMLQASELGLGSCWVCAFDPIRLREIFSIPDHYQIECLLPLGYPDGQSTPAESHFQRESLDNTTFHEQFPLQPKTNMSREEAWDLLTQYNKDSFHLKHALIVEGVMRYFARQEGYTDHADFWGIVGLLHDLDFELYPDQHCIKQQEIMRRHQVPEGIIRAAASHGYNLTVDIKPEHVMEKILYAADELTGLIGAVALMRPSRSVTDLELKSVKKKFKTANFAAGCSREVIQNGTEMLGWDLDQLIEQTILAMRSCEESVMAMEEQML